MCGRFTLTLDPKALKNLLDASFDDLMYTETLPEPQYNIAPSEKLLAIIYDQKADQYRLGKLKWGFEPFFAEGKKSYQIINARLETIAEKPAFKTAFKKQRCLVLADGFFEWQRQAQDKTPYYVKPQATPLFAFAGIYSLQNESSPSVAIITSEAKADFKTVHDRMPLMLDINAIEPWFKQTHKRDNLKDWLTKHMLTDLLYHPISKAVNNPSHNDPTLIQPQR